MFKPGDRVICKNNEGLEFALTVDKIYTVISIDKHFKTFQIMADYKKTSYFTHSIRFISLRQERSRKLKKICSNQEI